MRLGVSLLLTACFGALVGAQDVPILTVCEALRDIPRYTGKSIIVVGRLDSTSDGSLLREDCGLKVTLQGRELGAMISATYAKGDYTVPAPRLPKTFHWDTQRLQQKLSQVKRSTRLRAGGEWGALFGRLETQPRAYVSGGVSFSPLGFGHGGQAPAELVYPLDGSGYLQIPQ